MPREEWFKYNIAKQERRSYHGYQQEEMEHDGIDVGIDVVLVDVGLDILHVDADSQADGQADGTWAEMK